MKDTTNEPLMTEAEVAELLGFTVRSLQSWRQLRKAPKSYRIVNKGIRYRLSEVLAWIEAKKISQDDVD